MTERNDDVLATLRGSGRAAAVLRGASDTPPGWSPRPYLHPVTTPAGVVVTDTHPEDHGWHLGASVTLQDVGGVNFWGGRTYVRDQGYTWREDHGRVEVGSLDADEHGLDATLRWRGPDGHDRLHERRHLQVGAVTDDAWTLQVEFTLENVTPDPLPLGSPATNGRTGAGYGGWFWRLPSGPEPVRVFTAAAEGEADVHGTRADWIAVQGTDVQGRGFTVAWQALDDATRDDPWFVRVAGYPGICSALAFVDPLTLPVGGRVTRRFEVTVADGWRRPDGADDGGNG
ncbi:PmoA family protein [Egicoccus sp. AB-alg6-2]|uniref:DUF6807 domain-containing protein n=1 Tax=Egicoccus sp. AB-alg6-2 TaxID=3242692 RepID=UPI00359EEDA9